MISSDQCMSDEVLVARAAGELPEPDRLVTDAHLSSCESCRVVLAELMRAGQERPKSAHLGRYVLGDVLGSGGMGTVWSAWDPQLRRLVAVKILHQSHDGDSHRTQRFLAERQMLARLEHPNIARLLDGGETDDGRSYFVMEQIDGLPIDRYCTLREVSVADKLQLMRSVCAAVNFAHQHLIVHRDLKPSNILVTPDGTPKLLDFGIAKMLQDSESLTQTGMAPMTPAFAAPEQVRREPTTTAGDIYSLGVVMYELLTGASPYGVKPDDFDGLLRAIREVEPPPPSSRARDEKTKKALQGDVDGIVLMALRKDARDRYPTAQALSDDIRHSLEGLPTQARKSSRVYRAVKFVRRHKTSVAAVVAALLALVAGLVATLYQARAASRERDLAQRRFAEVRSLAHAVLFDYHDGIAGLAGSTELRERLVKDAVAYLEPLQQDAKGDVGLLNELAAAWVKVGDVQGDPFGASLGHTADARKSYLQGRALAESVLALDPKNRDARRTLARSRGQLGSILEFTGEMENAEREYQLARDLYAALAAEDPKDVDARYEMSTADISTGQVSLQRNDLDRALQLLTRGLEAREQVLKLEAQPKYRRGVSVAHTSVADVMVEQQKMEEADRHYQVALSMLKALRDENPDSARYAREHDTVQLRWVAMLRAMGRASDALPAAKDITARSLAALEADPKDAVAQRDAVVALTTLAGLYDSLGDVPPSIENVKRALEINARSAAGDPDNVQLKRDRIRMLHTLGRQQDIGNLDEDSAKTCTEATRLAEKLDETSNDRELLAEGHACLADLYSDWKPELALVELATTLQMQKAMLAEAPSARRVARISSFLFVRAQVLEELAKKAKGAKAKDWWQQSHDAYVESLASFNSIPRDQYFGKSLTEIEYVEKGVKSTAAELAKR